MRISQTNANGTGAVKSGNKRRKGVLSERVGIVVVVGRVLLIVMKRV